MSQIIKNRYQITKLIGKGGMAEVYLAWDTILNREVAVKVLKSDMADDEVALERFKREANATTDLSHPNIVDVYDVGDDEDKHYIVMEYIKGYTLKQLIKKRGSIPYKEAVWMMKQLAGALMEAHRKGIIHRDVKSQNVLIKPDGTIKLSDFGIAIANGAMELTKEDSILGSVHYLAPELSRGRQASMQSDIYSLGIVFYELLTGDVPFKADTPVQVALMHVKDKIPSIRSINHDIPQSVENIILKSTAKSLSNRYKNVALMLQDLNECLKPNHLNDRKIVLDNVKENGVKQTIRIANQDSNDSKLSKKKYSIIFISIISVLSIALLIAILFFSGIIGSKSKLTKIPNVINLTVLEAKDILTDSKLNLDTSRISYELSDSIEKDRIISITPEVNSEVDINTKVKLVVSEGIYKILDNYVGKNYKDAEKDLTDKKFIVSLRPSKSDKTAGIVISQSIEAGEKYNPEMNNSIILEYATSESVLIDENMMGMHKDDFETYLKNNNVEYEIIKLDKSEFSETELLDSKPLTIIRTEPSFGSAYLQTEGSKVKAYYYGED